MTSLSDDLIALLRGRATCHITTLMPDGSPQLTLTWVDTDGEQVVVNSVLTHQKVRNVQRDPRVALAIGDPAQPWSYTQIRGEVVDITTDGAVDHIEALSRRYTGQPYPWYGGRDQTRVRLLIRADRISAPF
ncbi:PPOX class F420-dependent oxidoreductase [Nakamurella flava]|uniref:PPOX class F420-dependent oxidoreductase n=1 Tax=Nakamurella flava TaxID=2576308 RepID=A0A4V6CSW9_9ACTN|nr:PPOX class F420-dependent oxidoreductase [Nakamurella flava]TKV61835.1 PPOX class F420-dependent oxidoreductase [Nakamurella flava]